MHLIWGMGERWRGKEKELRLWWIPEKVQCCTYTVLGRNQWETESWNSIQTVKETSVPCYPRKCQNPRILLSLPWLKSLRINWGVWIHKTKIAQGYAEAFLLGQEPHEASTERQRDRNLRRMTWQKLADLKWKPQPETWKAHWADGSMTGTWCDMPLTPRAWTHDCHVSDFSNHSLI